MRLLILTALCVALSSPAMAQSRKELAAQNAALAERVVILEDRMLTGDPAAERLMQRIDALEASQRTLTGEAERLRFERDELRADIAALNEVVKELESLAARTTVHLDAVDLMAVQAQQQTAQPGQPQQAYPYGGNSGVPVSGGEVPLAGGSGQPSAIPSAPTFREVTIPVQETFPEISALPSSGKRKLAEGDFVGAQTDFKKYLEAMPDATNAGEVSFWLGETYYVRQGYADAADAYITSMRKAPRGIKAPDAMVRLAAALRGLGQTAEACKTLDSFPVQFPNAPPSVRAKAQTEIARTGC